MDFYQNYILKYLPEIKYIVFRALMPSVLVIITGILIFHIIKFFLKAIDNIRINKSEYKYSAESFKPLYTKKLSKRIKKFIKIIVFLVVTIIIILSIRENFLQIIYRVFTTPFYKLGTTDISLASTFFILFLGYLSYWLSISIKKISKRFISQLPYQVAKRYSPVIQLMGYLTLLLSFIVGISLLGINMSSFTVIFGVLGVGLGFGLQDIVSNFFSGLVISFSRIISEGDRVFIQGIEGQVVQINLINTLVRSLFNEELIIPNKLILNESIQNYTHSDSHVVVGTHVSVAYSSDIHKAKEILISCAEQIENRIQHEPPIFRLKSFDDSGISLAIYIWIKDVTDKYQVISDLNMLIWEAFKVNKIEIPFPQLDVKIKKEHEVPPISALDIENFKPK